MDSPLLKMFSELEGTGSSFEFFVGCPTAAWIHSHSGPSLFVSRRRMPKSRRKKAVTKWALDSGGFTELQKYGKWMITPERYAELILDYSENIGMLQWAAQQDWMCEPFVIKGGSFNGVHFHGTKRTVRDHQELTVENFLKLREMCGKLVIPVIQGYSMDEYHDCIELFERNGVDLCSERVVGVGSVCRRQGTQEAIDILRSVYNRGIKIHGFGLKTAALRNCSSILRSADSMAWSFSVRKKRESCGRINPSTGKPIASCSNCYHAAKEWHDSIVSKITDTMVLV